MISFSAKDLCTRSCMQIKMFRERPELKPQPTENQKKGNELQSQIAKRFSNVIGEEMGGCLQHENMLIYFSNDIVCLDKIIEVKSVDKNRKISDWYLQSSFLQCAIYKTLTHYCKNFLKTASFHVKNGNKYMECSMNDSAPFLLYFGEKIYQITVLNYEPILKFILEKAKSTLDWDTAKTFDLKYKKNEYGLLKKYFTITQLY